MKKIICILTLIVLLFSLHVFSYENDYTTDTAFDYTLGLIPNIIENHNTEFIGINPFQSLWPDGNSPAMGLNVMPSSGNVRAIVLILEFPDKPNSSENPQYLIDQAHIAMEGVSELYYEVSYGKLNITFDIFYHLAENIFDYYRMQGINARASVLIEEALLAFVDSTNFYINDDEVVGALYVKFSDIHTIRDFNSTQHHAFVRSFHPVYVSGMRFGRASWTVVTHLVGTLIHETGHLLGLPDLYHGATGGFSPIPISDIMVDSRSRYHNMLHKYLLGWVEPVIISQDNPTLQEIKIYRHELQNANGAQAVIIVPDENKLPFTEFFMLEYRYPIINAPQGVYLWHPNTTIHTVPAGWYTFTYRERYLRIIPRVRRRTPGAIPELGGFTSNFGLFRTGDLISPFSDGETRIELNSPFPWMPQYGFEITPNSNFYDDVHTGIFMEVLYTGEDYARVLAGFLQDISRHSDFEIFEIPTHSRADYDVRFKLRNMSSEERVLHLIIAEYAESGLLANVEIHKIEFDDTSDILDKQFSVQDTNNEIRIMLWDMENIMPIVRMQR